EDSEFVVVRSSLRVSIPPVFAANPRAGVKEMLDSMLMRYVPALDGVVLAHSNLAFRTPTARIVNDCPCAVCDVEFDATVWSPQVGMKLSARINLSSPDHIALLVHRTFNVSIPRHHIPTDSWEFEYGPAENDPEYGAEAGVQAEEEVGAEGEAGEEKVAEAGRWIHSTTGDRLGGKDGILEFTVIGLTVANQMLSLIGSIQPDPFSPAHVPQNVPASSQHRPSPSTPPPVNPWDEEEEGE
ncbi:hypothetical protein PUNSTDRAFT_23075, partial [Punctularia strigosozonata HHB-11173 SS5]|uniref:uncharacterized protein n=1 Tax=Punctularia strigosozonata (strain HHB-11173) TaxID=741275 RepID=UPI0004417216